jgi:SAM-dependent methyltransferase
MSGEFDVAFRGDRCTLLTNDGATRTLAVSRWAADPDPADVRVLRSCRGPTLDIGCGPGRLTAALSERGVVALGVDTSPLAVRMSLGRNGLALCRSVFDHLPGEGRWHEALLIDGNIGIGGDPQALLRRVHQLLRRGGRALVEVEPPGVTLWKGTGQVVRDAQRGGPFPWAIVGADALVTLAAASGFVLHRLTEHNGRWFGELTKSRARSRRRPGGGHNSGANADRSPQA